MNWRDKMWLRTEVNALKRLQAEKGRRVGCLAPGYPRPRIQWKTVKRRRAPEMQRRLLQAEEQRRRLSARDQLAEALRFCHGIVDRETLLKLCPWLNIRGAIEVGLLVESTAGDGQQQYIAGLRLKEDNCDLEKLRIETWHPLVQRGADPHQTT